MKRSIYVVLPLLLLGTVFGIFAFRPLDQKTEYAMMTTYKAATSPKAISVYFADEVKQYPTKKNLNQPQLEEETSKVLNQLMREGWRVVSTDATGSGYTLRTIHLERTMAQ